MKLVDLCEEYFNIGRELAQQSERSNDENRNQTA